MKDKVVDVMLGLVKDHFNEIHICKANYERALPVEEIIKLAEKQNIKTIVEVNPSQFVKEFERREQSDCLVVLGSIYLLGDIKSDLLLYKSA
jgi:dihydrofolate synthase/folylpolyglutamate synthase